MKVTFRRAVAQDAAAISEIYALSWKAAYRSMVPQQYLDELKLDFWTRKFDSWVTTGKLKADLICADGVPVGCVAYGKAREEQFADWGEIVSIYVRPDCFHKGFGQKLMEIALTNLKADGYQNCYLWVLDENKNARQFYERNGFICNHDICYSEILGKQLTELRYIKNL